MARNRNTDISSKQFGNITVETFWNRELCLLKAVGRVAVAYVGDREYPTFAHVRGLIVKVGHSTDVDVDENGRCPSSQPISAATCRRSRQGRK